MCPLILQHLTPRSRMSVLWHLCVALACAPLGDLHAETAVAAMIYVAAADTPNPSGATLSATGTDDGRTLQQALRLLGPQGGEIRLLPGTFVLDSAGRHVTIPSNVTINGSGAAVIECRVAGQQGALRFADCHNVTIRGIRFRSTGDAHAAMFAMMNVGTGKSRFVTVEHCDFEGFSSYALRMNMPGRNFRFIHNRLRTMGTVGKGGSAINGARMIDSLIGWNQIEDCGVDAGDWAIYISAGGARNLQVVGNSIFRCAAGIKDLGDGSDRKILISQNTIEGVHKGRSIALGGCRDIIVTNNLITMQPGGQGIGTETSVHHLRIAGNVIDMNGAGQQGGTAIEVAADDSSFVSVVNNHVFGGHPTSTCIRLTTVKQGLISGNLLQVEKGTTAAGNSSGGCGIHVGRPGSPHVWDLLVQGNRIYSPVSRNVAIQLSAGTGPRPKSAIQIQGNSIRGFQFALTLDRQQGGSYRDVIIRGNTSQTAPLLGKRTTADRGIVVADNIDPTTIAPP